MCGVEKQSKSVSFSTFEFYRNIVPFSIVLLQKIYYEKTKVRNRIRIFLFKKKAHTRIFDYTNFFNKNLFESWNMYLHHHTMYIMYLNTYSNILMKLEVLNNSYAPIVVTQI